MFSIGFAEMLLIAVVLLLVVGPERLPEAIRAFSMNMSRFRRFWARTKHDLESELGLDEIRREIHNAEVLEHIRETQKILNEDVSIGGASEDAKPKDSNPKDTTTDV